jgi:hypothetical protein
MMENVTLIGIEALVIGTSATNEIVGSHELANTNEQVQSNVIIAKEH